MSTEYEHDFKLPASLRNDFRPDSRDIMYRAKVYDLKFNASDSIEGYASLEKYRLEDSFPSPMRTMISQVLGREPPSPQKVWVLNWSISTYDESKILHWRSGILYRGQPRPAADGCGCVRAELVTKAANKGFVITDRLLDSAFGDIERKLKKYSDVVDAARHKKPDHL